LAGRRMVRVKRERKKMEIEESVSAYKPHSALSSKGACLVEALPQRAPPLSLHRQAWRMFSSAWRMCAAAFQDRNGPREGRGKSGERGMGGASV